MKLESKKYWDDLIKKSITKFFILSALYGKECYGYELASLVFNNSYGSCSPSFGTIYPTLNLLLRGKYVEKNDVFIGRRKKKVYFLTGKGRKAYQVALRAFCDQAVLLSSICDNDLRG